MAEPIDFFPITVEQTSWQAAHATLASIRRDVFIVEQNVPEHEELDDKDATALHWIAWGSGDTPMGTARLVGNKVGRMAVAKPFRKKGVGSALLRAIIRHGIAQNMGELVLDAQVHAARFYEDNGFAICGGEFIDAGIPHVPMQLDLSQFQQRRHDPAPPDISAELRNHQELHSAAEFRTAALQLANQCERRIRIFSDHLLPDVYDNDDFCHAIQRLAVNHPYAQVQILVRDSLTLARQFHPLMATYHRLPSRIELRRLADDVESSHSEFVTGDDKSLLYVVNPSHFQGFLCLYTPVEARRLNDEFESLWNNSAPDPQVRRLYI